jgi:hypothetical protein
MPARASLVTLAGDIVTRGVALSRHLLSYLRTFLVLGGGKWARYEKSKWLFYNDLTLLAVVEVRAPFGHSSC